MGTGAGGEIIPAAVTPAPDGLSPFTRRAIEAGMPASTRRAYETAWADFTAWCAETGRGPLPASPDTMAEYATWLCYRRPLRDQGGMPVPGKLGLSPSSVRRAIAGISYAHALAGAPAPRSPRLSLILKGYEAGLAEARDPRARPRKAAPLSPKILAAMAGPGLEGERELIRLRDTAMFYLAYSAATRVSELARINIEDVAEDEDGLVVAVYRVKNRRHADVRIPAADAPLAIAAVRRWIAALAREGHTAGPLFPRIGKTGKIGTSPYGSPDGRLAKCHVESRFARAAEAAGIEGRITVHSARRGLATQATLAGHGLPAIAYHGGWSPESASLKGYIDEAVLRQMNPLRDAGA